jgi:peroxiredoxin
MINHPSRSFFVAVAFMFAACLTTWAGGTSSSNSPAHSLQATNPAAAFAELVNSQELPPGPAAWATNTPSLKEQHDYFAPYILALEDKARDFYTRFPSDAQAVDAKLMELQLLQMTIQWGETEGKTRFVAVAQSLGTGPGVPDGVKTLVAQYVKQMDALHKPMDLQFTAVDGRKVNLADLKGKVVLLDFWATWCLPCLMELPNVKTAYNQYHAQGLEVIGISLDEEKDKLIQFTKNAQMEWPQYFDGLQWSNKYVRHCGINEIPSMWLIDKKGVVQDEEAQTDLGGKVTALLAE